MRQHVRRDSPVVLSKLLFRKPRLLIQNLLGMRQPHGSARSGRFRRRLRLLSRNLRRHSTQMRRAMRALYLSDSRTIVGFLPSNILRRLILTKPLERRLTHKVVRGPCSKIHLSHQLGLHPDRPAPRLRRQHSRKDSSSGEAHPADREELVCLLRKTRSGAPRINQFLAVVVPKQQRTNSVAPIRRQRKPADDKLLLMNTLQLQPVTTAATRILARSSLGDDALQHASRMPSEIPRSVRFNMLTEPQILAPTLHDPLQHLLTLNQPADL